MFEIYYYKTIGLPKRAISPVLYTFTYCISYKNNPFKRLHKIINIKKALQWLFFLKHLHYIKKSLNFAYVIVPEFHKDGAIHFHALIRDYNAELKSTNVFQNGKRVYNLTGFTAGFTNAQKLDDDQTKAAAYLTKYITKDMINRFNKRRYWASKNLYKPVKRYESLSELGLDSYIFDDNLVFSSDKYDISVYQFKRDSAIDSIYDLLIDRDVPTSSSVIPVSVRLCQASLPTIFKQTRPLPP